MSNVRRLLLVVLRVLGLRIERGPDRAVSMGVGSMGSAGDPHAPLREHAGPRIKGPHVILLAAVTAAGLLVPALPVAAGSPVRPSVDFDGDRRGDIVAAAPGRAVAGHKNAGAVVAVYGDGAGHVKKSQVWSQASSGVPGAAEEGDLFGRAVTIGDFNRDGFSDLAVGAPGEATGARVGGAGAVTVLYGARGGLAAAGSLTFTQGSPGVPSGGDYSEHFGGALAAGDFDDDGYDDLAVGTPADNINFESHRVDAGSVTVLHGSGAGLSFSGARYVTEASPGVVGSPGELDAFGATLAAGDVNGDGIEDLVVAAPRDVERGRGMIQIFTGSESGLGTSPVLGFWQQDLIPDAIFMGQTFALGDLNGDGRDDIAVGSRTVTVSGAADAGAVDVFYPDAGLSLSRHSRVTQNSPGVADSAEQGDQFGATVAVANVNGDPYADLVVDAPTETRDGVYAVGAVHVLRGSATGLTGSGSQYLTQASPGIPGAPEDLDAFGSTLAATRWDSDSSDDVLLGTPFEDLGTLKDAGFVTTVLGGPSGLRADTARAIDESDLGLSVTATDRFSLVMEGRG